MVYVVALIIAFLIGGLVYLAGSFFDKTADKRWAGFAGLATFLLVFLWRIGVL